ncbi:hypothetical protein INR49_007609, partial [Caranx melampygus]
GVRGEESEGQEMKIIIIPLCLTLALLGLSSAQDDFECNVTQAQGLTIYRVPDFQHIQCHCSWSNASNFPLANHGPKIDDRVVNKSDTTLITRECVEKITYRRNCISEGRERVATCEKKLWACVTIAVLLVVLILGVLSGTAGAEAQLSDPWGERSRLIKGVRIVALGVQDMKVLISPLCLTLALVQLSTEHDLQCSVTQAGGLTTYRVPDFQQTQCQCSWSTNFPLANQLKTDDNVVNMSDTTLITRECVEKITFRCSCISEERERVATCERKPLLDWPSVVGVTIALLIPLMVVIVGHLILRYNPKGRALRGGPDAARLV